jgi:hypothetical protein
MKPEISESFVTGLSLAIEAYLLENEGLLKELRWREHPCAEDPDRDGVYLVYAEYGSYVQHGYGAVVACRL